MMEWKTLLRNVGLAGLIGLLPMVIATVPANGPDQDAAAAEMWALLAALGDPEECDFNCQFCVLNPTEGKSRGTASNIGLQAT